MSGWSDHDWKQRTMDDNFVDASEAHSHLPSIFGQVEREGETEGK